MERFVSEEFKRTYNYENAAVGYEILVDKNDLDSKDHRYQIGIMISGDKRQEWFVQWTERWILC